MSDHALDEVGVVVDAELVGDRQQHGVGGRDRLVLGQLLHEHGGPGLLIDGGERPVTLGDLLPAAFGPDDLETRSGR